MRASDQTPLNPLVLRRDRFRCVACGFDLPFALAVHHVIPRGLGGVDVERNLKTLCANCHRLVHWLSVGRRLEGKTADHVKRTIRRPHVFLILRQLASLIRHHRQQTQLAANTWIARPGKARGPIPLSEALDLIATRNGFERSEAKLMKKVVRRALRNIPHRVHGGCAFRLLKDGRYLSVNAGNYLVFRVPAYSDNGKRQDADLKLIWPRNRRISIVSPRNTRYWPFAVIPYYCIDLSFEEASSLSSDEWKEFGRACDRTLPVQGTRRWVSNVSV